MLKSAPDRFYENDYISILGFSGASSHSGRRTEIANWAGRISTGCGSLSDVQMLAGYSALSATQRYRFAACEEADGREPQRIFFYRDVGAAPLGGLDHRASILFRLRNEKPAGCLGMRCPWSKDPRP